jgi:cysteinyl-tRNA synthetase
MVKHSGGVPFVLAGLVLATMATCSSGAVADTVDPKAEMRALIAEIAAAARGASPSFLIIPQNGWLLYVDNEGEYFAGDPPILDEETAARIDGTGSEDLYYGFAGNNKASPTWVSEEVVPILDSLAARGRINLTVDYCTDPSKVADVFARQRGAGRVPTATVKAANILPTHAYVPGAAESNDAVSLGSVEHCLYLLDPYDLGTWADIAAEVGATYYDLVIIDAPWGVVDATAPHVAALKSKPDGKRRLVIAYLSIGEAEGYRGYWKPGWREGSPDWIVEENPDWADNYKVAYWRSEWKAILMDYLDQIVRMGFDGAYLDIVDAFEYFR